MSFDEDPEVIADLRLREATERDSSRSRPSLKHLGTWRPDRVVGAWLCKRPGCGEYLDVTQEDCEYAEIFDRILKARGEAPLDRKQIAWCLRCRKALNDSRADKARQRNDEVAELVRTVKQSRDPRGEKEALEKLRKYGHPDVAGLLESLTGETTKSKRRPRGEL